MELMILGFWIAIGFALASVAFTILMYAVFGIIYLGAWIVGKIIGKELM